LEKEDEGDFVPEKDWKVFTMRSDKRTSERIKDLQSFLEEKSLGSTVKKVLSVFHKLIELNEKRDCLVVKLPEREIEFYLKL